MTPSGVVGVKPNGLCTMIPVISQSLNEIATELRDWLDSNSSNKKLDDWYKKYGNYFAFKKI